MKAKGQPERPASDRCRRCNCPMTLEDQDTIYEALSCICCGALVFVNETVSYVKLHGADLSG